MINRLSFLLLALLAFAAPVAAENWIAGPVSGGAPVGVDLDSIAERTDGASRPAIIEDGGEALEGRVYSVRFRDGPLSDGAFVVNERNVHCDGDKPMISQQTGSSESFRNGKSMRVVDVERFGNGPELRFFDVEYTEFEPLVAAVCDRLRNRKDMK